MSQPMTEKFTAVLSTVKRAVTDNEKFAALLIISKLTKATFLTAEQRRLLLRAIGIQFPIRLLATSCSDPEGENAMRYAAIGASIMSLVFTDKELAHEKGLTVALPLIGKALKDFLGNSGQQAQDVANNCFISLRGFLENTECRESSGKDVEFVFEALFTSRWTLKNMSGQMMQAMLKKLPWLAKNARFVKEIKMLAKNFHAEQGSEKFVICERLSDYFSVMSNSECAPLQDCLLDLVRGLEDILCSKLVAEQRRPALHLASEVLRHFGISQLVECSKEKKFVVIVTRIACIEIGLFLRDVTTKKSVPDEKQLSFLASCYHIAESFLSAVVQFDTKDDSNDDGDEDKIETKDVLTFEQIRLTQPPLADMAASVANLIAIQLQEVTSLTPDETLCLQLSIRMLRSWLSVEYNMLSAQGKDAWPLVPKALKYVTEIEEFDLMKALMFRDISLSNLPDVHQVLLEAEILSALKGSLNLAVSKIQADPENSEFQELLHVTLRISGEICMPKGLFDKVRHVPERVEDLHCILATTETLADLPMPVRIRSDIIFVLVTLINRIPGSEEGRENLILKSLDFMFEAFTYDDGRYELSPGYAEDWCHIVVSWVGSVSFFTSLIIKNSALKKLYLATKWSKIVPALIKEAKRTECQYMEELFNVLLLAQTCTK